MALSSLADAPSLSRSSESGLPPLGRSWSRARHDDRSIDALFDEGLVGIDEESPLELPVSTKTSSVTESTRTDSAQGSHSVSSFTVKNDDAEKQCSTPTMFPSVNPTMSSPTEECKPETPPDEEIFKRKWKENLAPPPSLEKKSSFDSLLTHVSSVKHDQEPRKKKDDDWGESSDILSMLPDGSEGDFNKAKPERRPSNISKKPTTERPDTPFEFGEYQPSCLSGKTPIAGRRRMSPTNFSSTLGNTEGTGKLSDSTSHTKRDGDDISLIIPVTPPVDKQAKPSPAIQQREKAQPKAHRVSFASGLENLSSQESEESGSDKRAVPESGNSESTLFERLRQTLVSKGILESEKNQLTDEVKQLKSENSLLKEEILKVEKEKLRIEREISEIEISSNSALCKQFSEDKEEAQKIVVQLSSEIHLLKNTCILADEKLSSLQRVYQEEVDILKISHAREMEAKENQLNSERAFVANQKHTMEMLTQLVSKSNDWCTKVDEIQHWMVTEKENSNKFRTEWLDGFERSMHQQHTFMNEWQNQLEELMRILSLSVHNIKDLQTTERDSLLRERAHLQALQEAVQRERSQSLADLTASRQKMDELRSMCLQEKESFLQKCFEEKKELAGKRDAVLRMKEQLYHADASLEKQLVEHAARIQTGLVAVVVCFRVLLS
ncbi:golgin subfamily B member 1-like [Selaginella moellendorffii]|uniref:golgin subfamily B member 1-like n=1 Tax=Selaginella moellendorffii TaxID=88036 RepID=UPI000D1D02B6|nr:golgin subfamily B member 1-like [Selaginella moellendorffii]|eukprot:XP_024544783.1 golgin subfamily B member 1-like [Selaginella moellendorffii]